MLLMMMMVKQAIMGIYLHIRQFCFCISELALLNKTKLTTLMVVEEDRNYFEGAAFMVTWLLK